MFLKYFRLICPFRGLGGPSPFRGWGFALLLAAACHPHSPSAPSPADPDPADSTRKNADTTQKNFFPITDYIRSEIAGVDSMPIAILKYSTQDNHTDSSFIRPEEFHRLAQEFISPELDKANFESQYAEKSFVDATTGFLTFTYSTQNKDLPLQRIDVLATPASSGAGPDQVQSIYFQKSFFLGDTLVVKKMLWSARKNFLIVTSLQPHEQAAVIRQVKVVWDARTPSE